MNNKPNIINNQYEIEDNNANINIIINININNLNDYNNIIK